MPSIFDRVCFFLLALCFAFALFSQCKALRCCSYFHTSFFAFVQNQIHNIIIKPLTALRCIFWLCFYQMYAINATENYKRKYNATKRKPVYRDITMQKNSSNTREKKLEAAKAESELTVMYDIMVNIKMRYTFFYRFRASCVNGFLL